MSLAYALPIPQSSTSMLSAQLPQAAVSTGLEDQRPGKQIHLSLQDAVALALRKNSDISMARQKRVVDRFAFWVGEQAFWPQWNAGVTASVQQGGGPEAALTSGMTLKTPMGTVLDMNYSQALSQSTRASGRVGTVSMTLTQPLLKGSWINTLVKHNVALQEQLAYLSFQQTVESKVVAVITAYMQVLLDQQAILLQQNTLQSSKKLLQEYRLRIRLGKMAPSELLPQQASYQSNQLQWVTQKNALRRDRDQLTSLLGLKPEVDLQLEADVGDAHHSLPDASQLIGRLMSQNLALVTGRSAVQSARNQLLTNQDNERWDLSLVLSNQALVAGRGRGALPKAQLSLTAPLNHNELKLATMQAQLAVDQAVESLRQQERDLVAQLRTLCQQIHNDIEQLTIAKGAVAWQEKSVEAAKLKLRYGRISAYELTQVVGQLLQNKNAVLVAKFAYQSDWVQLQVLTGQLLSHYGIHLNRSQE